MRWRSGPAGRVPWSRPRGPPARRLLVPAHRYLSGAKANEGEYATPFRDEALYHSAFMPVAALVLLGPPFGLTQPGPGSAERPGRSVGKPGARNDAGGHGLRCQDGRSEH